jgi:alpha,alpha-trehalase
MAQHHPRKRSRGANLVVAALVVAIGQVSVADATPAPAPKRPVPTWRDVRTYTTIAQHPIRAFRPNFLTHTKKITPSLIRGFSAEYLQGGLDDPKIKGGRTIIYVPKHEDLEAITLKITDGLTPAQKAKIVIQTLPDDPKAMDPSASLYLHHPYVVPTSHGRFPEAYNWDTWFAGLGLTRQGQVDLAKGMVENHLYEIANYGGKVLNANRAWSYGRSQPPVLNRMILDVYRVTKDKKWLASTLDGLVEYHRYWTSGPRLTKTGLSRYWDDHEGPAEEVVSAGTGEYDKARRFFKTHPEENPGGRFYRDGDLTPEFYKNDRAMRASGFDSSDLFGAFGSETTQFNPVGLNSFLHQMELDIAEISEICGQSNPSYWRKRASARAAKINELMWDEAKGLYFDHHLTKGKSGYEFATTFSPLWSGIATPEQAKRIVQNLPLFETGGGVMASTKQTGHQWDAPFVWAPLVYLTVKGLQNPKYGGQFDPEARRIAVNFLTMVGKELKRTGGIYEKYDGETRSAEVKALVNGYTSNEKGFAWTNGVAVALWKELPAYDRAKVSLAIARYRPDTTAAVKAPALAAATP